MQIGQMVTLLTERKQGSLSSNSEVNPRGKGKEYCKAITLRSGSKVATLGPPPTIVKEAKQLDQSETEVDIEQRDGDQPQLRSSNGKHLEVVKGDKPVARDPTPFIPYP